MTRDTPSGTEGTETVNTAESTENGAAPAGVVLDPDLLWNLGFQSFTRVQVSDILQEMYDALTERVGSRLTEGLDNNQIAKFMRIVSGHDTTSIEKWFSDNVPAYRETVLSEYRQLINTLRRAASLEKTAPAPHTSSKESGE